MYSTFLKSEQMLIELKVTKGKKNVFEVCITTMMMMISFERLCLKGIDPIFIHPLGNVVVEKKDNLSKYFPLGF